MNVNIADIAITSLETITCFDQTSGAYLFTLDELQSASLAQTEDKVDITGKQGRKLATIKRNKAVTVSGDNGLVSGGLWEAQTGSKFTTDATKVRWTDYVTASADGVAATSYKAVGTTGAEIIAVYKKNSDGTLGTKFEQDSSAASGKFTYAPATKALAFSEDDVKSGDELVVMYDRQISASHLDNSSDNYSTKCAMYIDALGEDTCSNVYRIQFYIPRADFSGEFTFDMGDNQTVHSFSADALAGSCGDSSNFFTYTIFESDAEDAE